MYKQIDITRCDKCGKRITDVCKHYTIGMRRMSSNTVADYDLCDECVRWFLNELTYREKMSPIWDSISEERLIEE